MIRTIFHFFKIALMKLVFLFLKIIPKNKKLVLFSSWFGKKYSDNPMYMYEFFLHKKTYKVFWYTRDKNIFRFLKKQKKPVVYSKSIKGIWLQIRAKMLVSSVQFADFNNYFIHKCIFLDLGHGFPNKQIGYKQPDITKRAIKYTKMIRRGVDFYMTVASHQTLPIQIDSFDLAKEHILYCNKPRTDVLFDSTLRCGLNTDIEELIKGKKMIVYMPTHRSCGAIPIDIETIFNLDLLQDYCEKNNVIFLIKKHYYHKHEKTFLDKYKNIFDITSNTGLDTQTLLYQADAVISDYSSCYIDYLLLNRPVILYTYDLVQYLSRERGLYLTIADNHVGYKVCSFDELLASLKALSNDWTDSLHEEGRRALREHYFDKEISIGRAREDVYAAMTDLLEDKKNNTWEEII